MMVDYTKYPSGKDGESAPRVELNGRYVTDTDLIIVLYKALLNKGVLTKADIFNQL